MIGYKLPNGFFKPWSLDGKFYGGELVKHRPESADMGNFYTLCDVGKVMYVYNQNHILVEWSKCNRMKLQQYKNGFLDIHSANSLEFIK